MQGSRASSSLILAYLSQNIPIAAPRGVNSSWHIRNGRFKVDWYVTSSRLITMCTTLLSKIRFHKVDNARDYVLWSLNAYQAVWHQFCRDGCYIFKRLEESENDIAPSRLWKILRQDVLCDIKTSPKWNKYRRISNIRRTESPNLDVSRLVLQLSLPNPIKPGVKSRMKM